MDMAEVMRQKEFVVVGDTLNEEKFACKIKNAMIENGYSVHCVGKELDSINDVEGEIDIIDLCIRADKGIEFLKECNKDYKGVVLQPGASSDEIKSFLDERGVPYIDGCLLVGLKKYK
ncbi:MAG: CoA-binding protein [Lachnospiraceae bacterium]|nr:CoA-binding protein [Lachnospiraceae bacterium]